MRLFFRKHTTQSVLTDFQRCIDRLERVEVHHTERAGHHHAAQERAAQAKEGALDEARRANSVRRKIGELISS